MDSQPISQDVSSASLSQYSYEYHTQGDNDWDAYSDASQPSSQPLSQTSDLLSPSRPSSASSLSFVNDGDDDEDDYDELESLDGDDASGSGSLNFDEGFLDENGERKLPEHACKYVASTLTSVID
jgi:hypothetical protein